MKPSMPDLLYGLNDKPPLGSSLLAALQHLAAVFGGIVTAPLIIARGMELSAAATNYLVISSLLVSGLATLLQISRIGMIGSGLLSVQGTSFTFIGAILFAFFSFPETVSPDQRLATIFGSAAVAALIMLPVCYNVHRLRHIFTSTVTGATVVLLGTSLVMTTLGNLLGDARQHESSYGMLGVLVLAALVFSVALAMALSKRYWLRMSSIVCAMGAGFVISLFAGLIDFSLLSDLSLTFLPEPFRFGIGFDWRVVLILLPIFLVTATESIGDLTATSALSRLPVRGPEFWARVRGGLLADAINSLLASLLATFPNTTFSQNNGVIRLTGIASRHVGVIVALMLIVLGLFPVVGGIFQLLPNAVLYGATLLMFGMVALAGVNILRHGKPGTREWSIAAIAIIGGWLVSRLAPQLEMLHPQVQMLLQFPVSTGAFIAILLELCVPGSTPHDTQHAGSPETA